MGIGGIGNYGAAYYRTMNNATMNKNLISGMNSTLSSASDPMASLYNTLKDSALFKTKGYHALVEKYYQNQADDIDEQVRKAAEDFETKDTEEAVKSAADAVNNMKYDAAGMVFADKTVSSGIMLDMQI